MDAKDGRRTDRAQAKRSRAPPKRYAATGRDRESWFAVLDAWGGAGRAYREITTWLVAEYGLSKWWAQKLAVEYEEARGVRAPPPWREAELSSTPGRRSVFAGSPPA